MMMMMMMMMMMTEICVLISFKWQGDVIILLNVLEDHLLMKLAFNADKDALVSQIITIINE